MTCATCGRPVPEGSRFCPGCGSSVDADATVASGPRGDPDGAATVASPRPDPDSGATIPTPRSGPAGGGSPGLHSASLSSSGSLHGRFPAGTMITERYRIVGLLGRGGMGEVYRADDLTLGQSVALKFLPEALARDPERRTLFLNEVRTAREIAHPNVCRVYDVGEVDGQSFLSMEYVDGEDLSGLLRRIGRIPGEKAVEISRQLCAGIAALHDRGLLHRDLKPSNVMIDGRGKVRITDFGLAIPAESEESGQRVGTPAYMAPELVEGKRADVRSDVYALGLVLYEIYTGRRAFTGQTTAEVLRLQREGTPTSPSSIVSDLDPAVERVLARCLEKDPGLRPSSAIQVAAALPGGDPLRAALAAGEIPSLEMVANAGERGGIRPALGVACVAAVVAALVIYVLVGSQSKLYRLDPLAKSPPVLVDRAREMLASFGYPDPPADTADGFRSGDDVLAWIAREKHDVDRWETLRDARPAGLQFWYRESPDPMVPMGMQGTVDPHDPPYGVAGRSLLALDTTGRLLELSVVPPTRDEPDSVARAETDWSALFAHAGLEIGAFREAEPEWVPKHYADVRRAWVGPSPDDPDREIRVEAASYRGLPVEFRLGGPWTPTPGQASDNDTLGMRIFIAVFLSLVLGMLVGAVFMAVRNVRRGRGDQVGARRLSLVFFCLELVVWALNTHHVAGLNAEINKLLQGVAGSLMVAALFWTFYLALEPYARRTWPNLLVSWSRLLTGRFRDPLVGRDVLVGGVFFLFNVAVRAAGDVAVRTAGHPFGKPDMPRWLALPDMLSFPAYPLMLLFSSIFAALFILLLLIALRSALRNQLAAIVVFAFLAAALTYVGASGDTKAVAAVQGILIGTVWALVLFRFGLVTFVTGYYFLQLTTEAPLTFDTGAWYWGASFGTMAVIFAITLFALRIALAGRPLAGPGAGSA